MTLATYRAKRTFSKTPEPSGKKSKKSKEFPLTFVIQKHHARRLHYDFRLELNGVLVSWAVPKGPSTDPSVKRLAIHVEDHPIEYGGFEGIIPQGSYGAGKVIIWDKGTYVPDGGEGLSRQEQEKLLTQGLKKGELKFTLKGKKLKGSYALVQLKNDETGKNWLLIKHRDAYQNKKDITLDGRSVKTKDSIHLDLSNVPKKSPPHFIKPMLGYLTDNPFNNKEWIFEIKWDGYRAIADINHSKVALYSRNNQSFNSKFPEIVKELTKLNIEAVLDGEVVVVDKSGNSNFQLLQNYLNHQEPGAQLRYCVFDILFYQGRDLRDLPLTERKSILKELLAKKPQPSILYSDHIEEKGNDFYRAAVKNNLEGIMAKNSKSAYVSQRSKNWLKIKVHDRQEAIITGFTKPRGARKLFGALILGLYKNGELTYLGHVGGGFNETSLKDVYAKLKPLITSQCPFKKKPKTNMPVTWVKPKLLCEISFQEWTQEGIMRQPIFQGLRSDKPAKEVKKEEPIKTQLMTKSEDDSLLTHPDRIFWQKQQLTKGDLFHYYEQIAPYILPFLKDRPIMMHRFPNGVDQQGFFQKDAHESTPKWVKTVAIQHTDKKIKYIVIQDVRSLLAVANLGTVEIHTFLNRYQNLDYPDYCVLDLDPEDLPFEAVVEVAQGIHRFLDKLDVPHFCKTSGKRGLHIFLPLKAKYTYEQVVNFGKLIAQILHESMPSLTSVVRKPKDRQGKVYIDYLQNGATKTVVAPYSARAVDFAGVSTPLLWKEVKQGLDPQEFTIVTVPSRVKKIGPIFKEVLGKGINLETLLKKLFQK
jgi:bifunctional non-homologous end joining protein LigD